MSFPRAVERWRATVQAELTRQRLPLPIELVLAVMTAESGGDPDALSKVGAMGLMQVMPGTLRGYNQAHGTNYTDAQFKASPEKQIRVGIWVLRDYWRKAYRYLASRTQNIAVDLLSKASSLFYVYGPKGARDLWNRTEPTYEAFARRYPNSAPIKNGYATKIWRLATENNAQWDTDAINSWLGGDLINDGGTDDDPDDDTNTDTDTDTDTDNGGKTKTGALIAILIMIAAYSYFKKGK